MGFESLAFLTPFFGIVIPFIAGGLGWFVTFLATKKRRDEEIESIAVRTSNLANESAMTTIDQQQELYNSLRERVADLEEDNKKLRDRVKALEKENRALREENNRLKSPPKRGNL